MATSIKVIRKADGNLTIRCGDAELDVTVEQAAAPPVVVRSPLPDGTIGPVYHMRVASGHDRLNVASIAAEIDGLEGFRQVDLVLEADALDVHQLLRLRDTLDRSGADVTCTLLLDSAGASSQNGAASMDA